MRYLALLLILLGAGFAQTKPAGPPASSSKPTPPAAQKPAAPNAAGTVEPLPDEGTVKDDTYTSDYFNFTYTFPEHLELDEQFMEGREDVSGQAVVLLAAYGPSAQPGRREGVVISADRLDAAPAADWASVYFQSIGKLLAAQDAQRVGPTREYDFDGHKFYRADFQRGGDSPGVQSVLVTLRRGYVLSFDFAAVTAAECDQLIQSLNSLHFAALKSPAITPKAPPKP